jgi:proteic killer suppression protein
MIKSFRDRRAYAILAGQFVRGLDHQVQQRARTKLEMLDAAQDIQSLRAPPSNRLEKLSGDRADQWSIRINGQWRICFRWEDGPEDVEIVDYH